MTLVRLRNPSQPTPPAELDRSQPKEITPPKLRHHRKGPTKDLYQDVTDTILEAIENGSAPWQRPWDQHLCWPINGATGAPYHGINVLLLASEGHQDPRWCSYKVAKEHGWQVRGNEHGTKIFFYKPYQRETGEIDPLTQEPEVISIPVLKNFSIFNFNQMDGVPTLEYDNDHEVVLTDLTEQLCIEIIEASGADVRFGARQAAFSLSEDRVYMPDKESFNSDAEYYATLLHELGHWTGGKDRLNREFGITRDSEEYAKEELRAEMASAMLSMRLGLPNIIAKHASYVDSYLRILKNDKKEVFRAARDAEKIARYVLSFHPEFRDEFEAQHAEQMAAHQSVGAPEELFDATEFDFECEEVPGLRP